MTGAEQTDLIPQAEHALPATIGDILRLAVEKDINVDALERLVAMHERHSDRLAAQEFARDLKRFHKACPKITKNKTAKFPTKQGTEVTYDYAELDHIVATIRDTLDECGFSFSWDGDVEGSMVKATCTLLHVNGHKRTSSFACPSESRSVASPQQKYGIAMTYAKRRSFVDVLGLTTVDQDTDGARAPGAPITEKQASDLEGWIDSIVADKKLDGAEFRQRFLSALGAESIAAIRAVDHPRAEDMLKRKAAVS